MHNNMITINGQKMGKSLGNFITLNEFFSGEHTSLAQAYSPMTIRFFILQAHYRSTLDFSNEALQAAEKGLKRLLAAAADVQRIPSTVGAAELGVEKIIQAAYEAMNDDLNSPIAIATLFDAVRIINSVKDGLTKINPEELNKMQLLFKVFVFDVLGLQAEDPNQNHAVLDGLMETIIQLRQEARLRKDYATSDLIRDQLSRFNITLKDGKEGTSWEM
jgi:cysteinyl-tRNA synthetase